MDRVPQLVLVGVMGALSVGFIGLVLAGMLRERHREATTAWGYVTPEGEWAITPRFVEVGPFREGAAPVRTRVGWGYLRPDGSWLVEPGLADAGIFSEGRARVVTADGRTGWLAPDGSWAIEPVHARGGTFSEGRAAAAAVVGRNTTRTTGGLAEPILSWGYVDSQGTWVLEPRELDDPERITDALPFSEGLAAISRGGRYGFVDRDGVEVIPPRFDAVGSFHEGRAAIQLDGRWGYVDRDGVVVIPPQWTWVGTFSQGVAPVRAVRAGFIDRNGERAFPDAWESARGFSEDRAPVRQGGLWGFLAPDGRLAIEARFVDVGAFSGGLCAVAVDEGGRRQWGFVDKQGRPAFSRTFLEVHPAGFQEGLAAVRVTAR